MTTYHVLPRENGWGVREEPHPTFMAEFEQEGEAVEYARDRAALGDELLIHHEDGSVEDVTILPNEWGTVMGVDFRERAIA